MTTMTPEKLKPCPFCGEPARRGWFNLEYNVACPTNGCPGNSGASEYAMTPDPKNQEVAMIRATSRWNIRVYEDVQLLTKKE